MLNAALGGYTVQGTSVSMTVGAEGFYQFLLGPDAPASCRFQLEVTPPPGYTFESGMIPAETAPLSPPSTPGVGHPVQTNATAPTAPVGTATSMLAMAKKACDSAGIEPAESTFPPA